MLVLGYFPRYIPGVKAGSEYTAHEFMKALGAAGHEVHVVLSDLPGEDYDLDGVHVHPTHDKRLDILARITTADLVITQQESYQRAVLLAKKYRRASISFVHSKWTSTKYGDLTVYNTQCLAEEYAGAHEHIVCHPWVNQDDYRVEKTGDAVTQINLNADKGSATFYALAERFPNQRFLGVIGGHGPQIIRDDLPNVEIHELTDDMREVYAQTRVLLMPSIYESYGRVAIEAASSGIPAILAPTQGLMEAMAEGASYAVRDDLDTWERLLKKLLTTKGWNAASKRALERAETVESQREAEVELWVRSAEDIARRRRGIRG